MTEKVMNGVVKDEGDGEPASKRLCLAEGDEFKSAVSSPQQCKVEDKYGLNPESERSAAGARVPEIQFGTYKMKGEECYRSVLAALKVLIQILL